MHSLGNTVDGEDKCFLMHHRSFIVDVGPLLSIFNGSVIFQQSWGSSAAPADQQVRSGSEWHISLSTQSQG